ncbi:hypothetical protein C8F04DRAFT_1294713 [Mycena alexandri]|uniref:Protein kinase domain-containing protein n=1 Tax=Mycena alexandri TaxID=1745969 RepID=A0AAD6SJF5_9AGAR|nr:hypothetical protein C8F04DRAFT_1294713 [Mycena alexandri]
MADIVGLVASVLQLVDTVARARNYIQDFRNAPKEQQQLLLEIQKLEPLLSALDTQIKGSQDPIRTLGGVGHLQDVLLQLRAEMEKLTKKLDSYGSISQVSGRLTWPLWGKEDVQHGLDTIERFKSVVELWLAIDIRSELYSRQVHHIASDIEDVAGDLRKHYSESTEEQRVNNQYLSKSVRDIKRNQEEDRDDAKRQKILDWYSPLNFFLRQEEIFKTREPGTGEGILQNGVFREWKLNEGKTLWCRGIPGAGKTVLTSLVVDNLRTSFQGQNVGVAVIYLNYKEIHLHSLPSLLAGLWRQLIVDKPIPSDLNELYTKHYERRTRPFLDEDRAILCSIIPEYSGVFVLVDALDEYPEDERDDLLLYLSQLTPSINLMLTSRPHITIRHLVPDFQLHISAAEDDIRRYVHAQMKRPRLAKHVEKDPALQEAIQVKITDLTDLWTTVKAVRVALDDMQSTLAHTYKDVMERINAQSEDDKCLARRTLSWVSKAKRALHTSELQEALSFDPYAAGSDPDDLVDMDIILSVCAGLVIVDPDSRFVRLIHYTAQDYLDQNQETATPGAQTEIALTCITFASFQLEGSQKIAKVSWPGGPNDLSLLHYSIQHCLTHARGEPESDIRQPLLIFLANASKWRRLWDMVSPESPILRHVPRAADALWIGAAFNLKETCRYLIQHNEAGPVLREAISLGQEDIVRVLLAAGANANTEDPTYGTVLQLASYEGAAEIVRLLITAGADVNAAAQGRGTALQAASINGHSAAVEILINHGADVNSRAEPYGTALRAAALGGYANIASLLLEHGAEIDATVGRHSTALSTALSCGQADVARALIHRGANANDPGARGWTALGLAAGNGHLKIVQLLLQNGADPNVRSGMDNTPLQAAAFGGHTAVARMLIESGALANADGGQYGSALQIALRLGWQQVVDILTKNYGASDVEGFHAASTTEVWTPCQYRMGRTLRSGTDVSVKEAINIQTGRSYACKILNKALMDGKKHMVQNEIAALKRMSTGHPNIMTLDDYFETPHSVYLCFNMCTGGELLDRICAKGAYHESDAANLVRTILSAVEHIHRAGVVHGDLTAENLLFSTPANDADIIITDFGLSRIIDLEEEKLRIRTDVSGTLGYMAPEILLKTGYSKPVDVWALGVLTYFILAGYTPFDRETPKAEMEAIIAGEYEFGPREYWASVSEAASDFVRKCLMVDPEYRSTAAQALEHKWLATPSRI